MRIIAAILCAEVVPSGQDGASLLNLLDDEVVRDFDQPVEFAYYFVVEVEDDDVGRADQLAVEVVGPDGIVIAVVGTYDVTWPTPLVPGSENPVAVSGNVSVRFARAGPHEVRLMCNGRVIAARGLGIHKA